MVDILVPSEYGYILIVAILSIIQLNVFGIATFTARKRAGVPYPQEYAEKAEAEADFDKHLFNCKQRVHQNTLESFPGFAVLLFSGGLTCPKTTASAGAIYLLSRVFYNHGYSTGTVEKRGHGRFGVLGTLVMLGTSIFTIYSLFAGEK
ncbi:hypothetical protein BDB00DRAFT_254512 [Zychaea mexicana]|uniref:uncharacterized protein n=1 Tax=Zychaea mexicana TaxID=64656 RepID=UPI0022FE3706|nr:uncharacterized protein BDB00DRAFT_254512 [Zychaea mexicana]KAI9495147.1 hypothetical protein BDB00DRAFT_254512 [Zychaea mexicana]